jgi:Cu/Ag efflux pump CusA
MIRWIVGSSLNRRLLVVTLAVAMVLIGATQFKKMPVAALPEFGPVYVEVQTEALGLSAAEVEQFITVPLEQNLLNGVAWLDDIQSESINGLSSIMLIFEPGTDPMRARQMVQERLTQAYALPNVSRPPVMLQPLSATSRLMMIRLSSETLSQIDMSVLARWTIRPQLMGVPGVANVAIWGQREQQLQVLVDPVKLQANGVTLDQIIETTGNALWVSPLTYLEASVPGTGGFIDSPNQRLGIQHLLPITTPDDLAQVPLEGCTGGYPNATRHVDGNCPPIPEGRPQLLIGDVATVVENHQPLIGDAIFTDGEGLLLVVEKFPEANTLDVTEGVEAALAEMRPGLTGLEINTEVFRPATFIEMAIDNMMSSLLIGMLLVIILLAAFLFDWRVALISAIAIPISLVAAGLVLYWRGTTVNTLILAGFAVALGAIIDDAIVDISTIKGRLRQNRLQGSDKSATAIVLESSLEVRRPVIYATLIALFSMAPIFFIGYVDDLSSEFFRPLAWSYALALLASMLVALTLTPALALLLLAKSPAARRESPLLPWLQHAYDWALARFSRRLRPALIAVAVIALIGAVALPQLGRAMSPELQERDLLIEVEGAAGTSHPEMDRITTRMSEELRGIPGVKSVGAHIGRAITSDRVTQINSGAIWVNVDPKSNYKDTVATIEEVVAGYPGIEHEVTTYSADRIRELLSGSTNDIVVRVYGTDLNNLRATADQVLQALSGIDGAIDEQVELQVAEPQIEIEVDLAVAQEHGIKPGDVRRAAATLVQGIEVGNLFEDQKVFEVLVVGIPEMRTDLTAISNLMIDTPTGGHVRLGDVARVQIAPTPTVIKHDAVSRYIDVTANVVGRDVGAVANEIERAISGMTFPQEFHASVLGEYEERQDNERELLALAIAAAIGIFLLLHAALGSWRLALLAYGTLPLALVGGILTAFLNNQVLSLGALAGFLTVLAIAARNTILLITHFQRLEREDGVLFGRGLVMQGAKERLAPIVLTALATALILLPVVFAGAIPGHEIGHPMAVVVLGGLAMSTLLNLFVVPSLYLRLGGAMSVRVTQTDMRGPQLSVSPASD